MRVAMKVTSSNEYYNAGCEYALLDLSPELASLALKRIAALKEQKERDPDIDEVCYWAYFVDCHFDPWIEPADNTVREEACSVLGEMLSELKIEEHGVVRVPENFRVAPWQGVAVECEQMLVREDAIAFTAIPKHSSVRVETREIPLAMLEAVSAGKR